MFWGAKRHTISQYDTQAHARNTCATHTHTDCKHKRILTKSKHLEEATRNSPTQQKVKGTITIRLAHNKACMCMHAHARNRTSIQKGLRARNSPTCTLSQNGYGDLLAHLREAIPPAATLGDCDRLAATGPTGSYSGSQ